ncbi:AbrB family transcriptional regulator [Rhodococcus sp. X156]|uniref:AbrB family transcriptional regulator n=1 Tax=Rhodococcus sp. X156 TaxID=2499145 RepID=UPI000FD8F1A1|nr:AbrB family transcriptional regulator [Rhodococcus sp. X156]
MPRRGQQGSAPARWWAVIRRWLPLAVATAAVVAGLALLGVPSPALVGALLVGIVFALGGHAPAPVPSWAMRGAQAVLGVVIGALVRSETLVAVGHSWLPVLGVSLATLALSVGGGLLLGLHRDVDPLTGSLALTAGGASGLTAISRELGADDRVVAVVQYLRVVLVIALMPLAVAVVFHPGGGAQPEAAAGAPWYLDVAFLVVCCAVGLPLGRLAHLPAGALLGPLAVAAVLTVAGWSFDATAPAALAVLAYVVIGLQAGLRFTRQSLQQIRRILPLAVLLIGVVLLACAALGALLAELAGVSQLTGYLATTPGGLYAVLATARDGGGDVTFVLAVQVVRVVLMLAVAPALARGLARLLRPPPAGATPGGPPPAGRGRD